MGIRIAVIEPGKDPYLKEVEPETRSDGRVSYLKAFQKEVGGLIEYFEPLWGDHPVLITNEEFLANGSEPNRAIYANDRIHDTGYIDTMTYTHVPEVGELYGLILGTFIAVSYDEERNPQDMPDDEWSKVWDEFSGEKSINSCVLEILKIRERRQELGEWVLGAIAPEVRRRAALSRSRRFFIMTDKREWLSYYDDLKARPLAPELIARGWTPGECASLPCVTVGDLLDIAADDLKSIKEAVGFPKCDDLDYWRTRAQYLPRVAGLAEKGYWEAFAGIVGGCAALMPDSFALFYEHMPQELKRDFVIACCENGGAHVKACREAAEQMNLYIYEEIRG